MRRRALAQELAEELIPGAVTGSVRGWIRKELKAAGSWHQLRPGEVGQELEGRLRVGFLQVAGGSDFKCLGHLSNGPRLGVGGKLARSPAGFWSSPLRRGVKRAESYSGAGDRRRSDSGTSRGLVRLEGSSREPTRKAKRSPAASMAVRTRWFS